MNKVQLLGRFSRDPELNFAANSGTGVCKFSLAVNRMKKGETDFINCIAFGKTGEVIAQHFTKGGIIAIVGRIQTGSYNAKDGTKRYTTDVVVETFDFCGNNGGGAAKTNNSNGGNSFEEEMTPDYSNSDMPF